MPGDAPRVIEFLKESQLVRMDMSVAEVSKSVSRLDEVAGYVIAWEKYVLVVAAEEAQAVTRVSDAVDTRRALGFLQESKLVNLDMSVSDLSASVGRLDEVAGYVIAWEKYVLVVSELADEAALR